MYRVHITTTSGIGGTMLYYEREMKQPAFTAAQPHTFAYIR